MGAPKIQQTAAPDPVATAAAQTQMNKETAIAQAGLNSTNQVTPQGTLSYNQIGTWADGTPHFEATQAYSPEEAKINGLNNAMQIGLGQIGVDQTSKIGSLLSSPVDYSQNAINGVTSGMAAAPNARYMDASGFSVPTAAPNARYSDPSAPASRYTDPNGPALQFTDPNAPAAQYTNPNAPASRYAPDAMLVSRQNIGNNDQLQNQLFAAGSQRLNPILAQSRDNLASDLANKGLDVGSTGYDRAMTTENQKENDAYNQLFLTGQQQAFDQSATRANTTFGQDLSRTGQYFNQGAQKASQDFNQDLAGANYTQGVNAQNFGQDMTRAGFGMAANAQNYGQALSGANYTQGVNQQNYAQDLAGLGYTAGINQQNYGMDMSNAGYTQAALGQNFAQNSAANQQNYGMDQSSYADQMAQRTQALSELAASRNQPINEISALMGGTQVTNPTWTNTPNTSVQPTDYTGLVSSIFNGQVAQNNGVNAARAQASSGLYSGIGSVFGGLAGLARSDENLKEDITPLGTDPDSGHGIYAYRYKPETGIGGGLMQLGLMAQDVEKRDPDAVVKLPDGTKAVSYGRALGGLAQLGASKLKKAA